MDDSTRKVYSQFGGTAQPFIVIINGVTNSPSHKPWEILYRKSGYGGTVQASALRAVIDQVKAPAPVKIPPRLESARFGSEGTFEFRFESEAGQSYIVEASPNLVDWVRVQTFTGNGAVISFRETLSPATSRRFWRVFTP